MLSEEELDKCIQSVIKPAEAVPPKSPDLYPSQCDQSLLKTIIRESLKKPGLKKRADVNYVLEKIKSKKKIQEGNAYLKRVIDAF